MDLKIKKLFPDAMTPYKATQQSVGYDLFAYLSDSIVINPGETVKIKTGISIEITSQDIGGFIFARSGLASNHGIVPANCVGVIDNDYRGEIIIPLKNTSNVAYEIKNKTRIAQIVFLPTISFESIIISDQLSKSERGFGGFGSTGNN